jgi:D-sedoheptulose 7-phosphate isomerase
VVKGQLGDILIALTGSGNSPNIVKALKTAKGKGMKTYAICAFDGGHCMGIADVPIHFDISDMQMAEDAQLIVGHICMQWLSNSKPSLISDA